MYSAGLREGTVWEQMNPCSTAGFFLVHVMWPLVSYLVVLERGHKFKLYHEYEMIMTLPPYFSQGSNSDISASYTAIWKTKDIGKSNKNINLYSKSTFNKYLIRNKFSL